MHASEDWFLALEHSFEISSCGIGDLLVERDV